MCLKLSAIVWGGGMMASSEKEEEKCHAGGVSSSVGTDGGSASDGQETDGEGRSVGLRL